MKYIISLALLVLVFTPLFDTTPAPVPHEFCFLNGTCYLGNSTGDDTMVTNEADPTDTVTADPITSVCFGTDCYQLDSNGMIIGD